MSLLEAHEIRKRFAGITALDGVSLRVEPGEAVGLIGPNGAGKTTYFNCLLGMTRPDSGTVMFRDRDITRLSISKRARLGFGRTFQRIELFSGMTVRDHLLVAERARLGTGRFWKDVLNLSKPTADEHERTQRTLDLLGLSDVADRPVEVLSLGRGRLVEVGRALMTEPDLLLLDEPSSGLDSNETAALGETLQDVQARARHRDPARRARRRVRAQLREPPLRARFRHAHRRGSDGRGAGRRQRAQGVPRGVRVTAPEAAAMWRAERRGTAPRAAGGERGLRTVPRDLRRVAGAARGRGALVAGRERRGQDHDRPRHLGDRAPDRGPGAARRRGCLEDAPVPDRAARRGARARGPLGVRVAHRGGEPRPHVPARVRTHRRRPALQQAYELFPRLGERRKQVAGTLSGGEQRMLSLARVLVHPPRLLIADELSLGLAPIIVDEVYATLATVRDAGAALLIVEQHVGHALALADEVAVLAKGRVVYGGPVAELGDLSDWLLPAAHADVQDGSA